MLETLKTRRWLTWLLVATLWAGLCVAAARWQWHRWNEKSAKENRIAANYDAKPIPVGSVMTDTKEPTKADEWKQVTARGTYDPRTLMVRNRPGNSGEFGFEVVNVLKAGDQRIVVNRGWVANGPSAKVPSSIPKPPSGEVTVVGWVRPSESSKGRPEVSGQLASISSDDIAAALGERVSAGSVRMRSEKLADGSSPARPTALDKPSEAQAAGINLSYALQWGLGIVAGYAFVLMRARREHLDKLILEGKAPERARKPKKTRIWDEEDE